MDAATRQTWRRRWQSEIDAFFLYTALAEIEPDAGKRDLFTRLADVEKRHADRWQEIFVDQGVEVPARDPSFKARLLRRLARRFGSRVIVPVLARHEAGEVKSYLTLARNGDGAVAAMAVDLARESIGHAESLDGKDGPAHGEPWHHTESGDLLRNVIYGFNDGLTANFGLVAGVVGGVASGAVNHYMILLAGMAGMVADALSMGSSGYLASKSQHEVYAHEIEMERQEIAMMPDLEAEELALIYEHKGLAREKAREVAGQLMTNPDRALKEMTREELHISHAEGAPVRDGLITGVATAVGAFCPVFPFLFTSGAPAMIWSFGLAMAAHFGVGAARSFFTGRGILRSGIDMFLVGFGVAVVSYFFGDVLVSWLAG
jgi:predicted membrane protein (TIGR00267 family)